MKIIISSKSDLIASYQMILSPYNFEYQFTRYGYYGEFCHTIAIGYLDLENTNELLSRLKPLELEIEEPLYGEYLDLMDSSPMIHKLERIINIKIID